MRENFIIIGVNDSVIHSYFKFVDWLHYCAYCGINVYWNREVKNWNNDHDMIDMTLATYSQNGLV